MQRISRLPSLKQMAAWQVENPTLSCLLPLSRTGCVGRKKPLVCSLSSALAGARKKALIQNLRASDAQEPVLQDEQKLVNHESLNSDWTGRAREKALQALQARDPSLTALSSLTSKKTRKARRRRREETGCVDGTMYIGNICWPGIDVEEQVLATQFHPDQHNAQRQLNRELIQAQNCDQILILVSNAQLSLLTPLNSATALHRVAKHMEKVSMPTSSRLAFARKQEMMQLVNAAVNLITACTAQGVSNIAWALSKVGGTSLYASEMDVVGKAALGLIADLEPQHIANVAGAFSAMQLANTCLFQGLALQAALVADKFRPQELAQLLWAFASLVHSASPLLDSLDQMCGPANASAISKSLVKSEKQATDASGDMLKSFSIQHLAVLAWSYSVLGELRRPAFAKIWESISSTTNHGFNMTSPNNRSLSQLHQVMMSLALEYPDLQFRAASHLEEATLRAWNKEKKQSLVTSTLQKEIRHLLTTVGLQFVAEYDAAQYSVDLAVVDRKIAVEVDGPSHFARNTGSPLGHTILKARHLAAAGWRVVSVPYYELENFQGEVSQTRFIQDLLGVSSKM